MNNIAEIVIENASPVFDKTYSYIIPEHLKEKAVDGARVRIPFGRGNALRTGLILSTKDVADTDKLKVIAKVIDPEPLLNKEMLGLLHYIREQTFCSWFDALKLLIPTGLGIKQKVEYRLGEADQRVFEPEEIGILTYLTKKKKPVGEESLLSALEIETDNKALATLVESGHVVKTSEIRSKVLDDKITMLDVLEEPPEKLTKRQKEVLDFLIENAPMSLKEVLYYTGASRVVVDGLVKKEAVELYEVINLRGDYSRAEADENLNVVLSQDQQEAYEGLQADLQGNKTALLYGITGSGKTQVFLKLVEDTIAAGRSAIVMVPEISLTSQTVVSLQKSFGCKVAVLHSGLSMGERTDEWKRIKRGDATVVVGTRSAVFAPLESIGLIVIDEEQEHTYKSEKSPRFHARDIAAARMKYHNGLLLLSSATPSVESYHAAMQGRYQFYKLAERFGEAELPMVEVVDMSEPMNLSDSLSLSSRILVEIYYNLEHKEQSILLLNRRGYSTVIKCSSCGNTAECPSCSVAMTYHSANDSLVCHYCGYTVKRLQHCQKCGSDFIRYSGAGTQKLEEELKELFPTARILRMDMDTTMRKDSHRRMFDAFRNQEYDILIGTQMVAKGLNFPKVTLVGVINADQSLYSNDFRSYERSFSLLTQVVGRSGRGQHAGRALIQTYTPDHPIIELASQQNYEAFYKDEIATRKLHLYPPFCTLAGIGFVGKNNAETFKAAREFSAEFKRIAKVEYSETPFRILEPTAGEILKIAGKYRYKIVVKCRNDKTTRKLLRRMLDWFYTNNKNVSIFVDMNYDYM